MRILWYTSRKSFHIEGDFTQEQHIYVCWHGELFMSPQAYRYLHKTQYASAMISHHFDGELIAKVYAFLKIDSIRGSGRKGAKEVFLKAFRAMKEGRELLITPDGPRGPRHHMYDGAVGLAVKGKKPVCMINFTCSNYWQLKSWDKFVIPKPFSKIDFYIESLSLEGMDLDEAKVYLHEKMMKHTIV
ncbi:lysophospholipid acyltransferase family protein [Sulfurovum sp.]|uniref:lysophospholipid acyltransferase family protein n=1 Tax=Sulfurovum sp. TaxID=1969726 RepID=UPI003568889E